MRKNASFHRREEPSQMFNLFSAAKNLSRRLKNDGRNESILIFFLLKRVCCTIFLTTHRTHTHNQTSCTHLSGNRRERVKREKTKADLLLRAWEVYRKNSTFSSRHEKIGEGEWQMFIKKRKYAIICSLSFNFDESLWRRSNTNPSNCLSVSVPCIWANMCAFVCAQVCISVHYATCMDSLLSVDVLLCSLTHLPRMRWPRYTNATYKHTENRFDGKRDIMKQWI